MPDGRWTCSAVLADSSVLQMRGITAQGLRARVVAEMAENWSRYAPFIEDRLHANYLAKMAVSGEYAGEPELIALSKVWGVTIHVWGAVSTFVISSPDAPASLPSVHLANRDAGNYRDHYWAVDFREK